MSSKEVRITIRLEDELFQLIEFYAATENMKPSEVIRSSVEQRLRQDLHLTQSTLRRCLEELKTRSGKTLKNVSLIDAMKLLKKKTKKSK